MPLAELETFMHVAATENLSVASRQLGVPKSTVSRRISRLEEALGLRLLHRTARAVKLTPQGEELSRRCRPAIAEIAAVQLALTGGADEAAGLLRITAAPDYGGTDAFGRLLAEFRARYSKVKLDVELTSRMVDLVNEGFDLAFRPHPAGQAIAESLMREELHPLRSGLYASPAYLERAGVPRRLDQLSKHVCIGISSPVLRDRWPLAHRKTGEHVAVSVSPTCVSNDFAVVATLTSAGAGIGIVPDFLATTREARGELVRVLPAWQSAGATLSLVWPRSRHLVPQVRAFIAHVTEAVRHARE